MPIAAVQQITLELSNFKYSTTSIYIFLIHFRYHKKKENIGSKQHILRNSLFLPTFEVSCAPRTLQSVRF